MPPRHATDAVRVQGSANLLLGLFELTEPNGDDKAWKTARFRTLAGQVNYAKGEYAALLPHLERRQDDAIRDACRIQGMDCVDPLRLVVVTPLTCGLSSANVLENGMTLMRPWGLPLLAASSIKGIVSSWLAAVLQGDLRLSKRGRDKALKDSGLLPFFGSDDGSGSGRPGVVEFFDAWPTGVSGKATGLALGGTTVHYSGWYSKQSPPDGTENPNPIAFLTVAPGTRFTLRAAVRKQPEEKELEKPPFALLTEDARSRLAEFGIKETAFETPAAFIRAAMLSAATYHGFGSQVRKGFGRMRPA